MDEPTCHNSLDECGWWERDRIKCPGCGTYVIAVEPDRFAQMSDADLEAEA